MFRIRALVTAQVLVTLIFAFPLFAQNNDCCRQVGRLGTCVSRVRMGITLGGFECYPLPPRDERKLLEVVGCRSYNMAAELFGPSSCHSSHPGSDVSMCQKENDSCVIIEKQERVIHKGDQRVECVKGAGLLNAGVVATAKQQIIRGDCQVEDSPKEY